MTRRGCLGSITACSAQRPRESENQLFPNFSDTATKRASFGVLGSVGSCTEKSRVVPPRRFGVATSRTVSKHPGALAARLMLHICRRLLRKVVRGLTLLQPGATFATERYLGGVDCVAAFGGFPEAVHFTRPSSLQVIVYLFVG